MKKIFLIFISAMLMLPQAAYGLTDDLIGTDPVANHYDGRDFAADMIRNLNFTDVPAGHPSAERMARSGALDLVKGDNNGRFNPEGRVTNQEAIAFILRVMGLENEAQAIGAQLSAAQPAGSPLKTLWSLGYLNLAFQNGLITFAEYSDALAADQSVLTAPSFLREANASREDVAQWLYQALTVMNPATFPPDASRQKIYTFSDFQNIAADRVAAVEAVTADNIMTGVNGAFNPNGTLSRAEMATILANMDSSHLPTVGLEKKTGTVGGVFDGQNTSTATASLGRQFRIRSADGRIDVLQYTVVSDSSPQSGSLDAPVFKNGSVGGLLTLEEGDRIEYIVSPAAGEVIYVQVTGSQQSPGAVKTVQGLLQAVDAAARTVTIKDATGKAFTYPIAEGLFSGGNLLFSGTPRPVSGLPVGSRVNLRLKNNICDELTFVGEQTVTQELRGVVLENSPEFGYITFADNSGAEVTKRYVSGELVCEKLPFYMPAGSVSYLSRMFPSFEYNPASAPASEIEAGDIIFVTLDPNDPETITAISASTNYMMRYGKIRTFTVDGSAAGVLVEYENKQTAWFDIAAGIPITKGGRLIDAGGVMVGDWARFLVNQAIVGPGAVVETVKEITVEGGEEHFISNIVKGQLAGVNAIQNQIIIQNAQTLAQSGWADYQNLAQFSIAGRDIEFYANDARVTLDYVNRYLKRHGGEVYVALENNFTGEKVRRVTFRDSRDELLGADTVVSTDGNGGFSVTGAEGNISTDAGTIVRRYGRLVDGMNINSPDWAVVSLNGAGRAAVVDISDMPGAAGVHIARGRVISVDEGQSFKVQSMATLTGDSWTFTPVQREFAIDNQTLFLDAAGGTLPIADFLDYGETSVADNVYNIVVDGSRAARVIATPYATSAVRGTVYASAAGSAMLRDAEYLDPDTGRWSLISNTNATLSVAMTGSTITVKENRLANMSGIVDGDFVRVTTTAMDGAPQPGAAINAVIVRVDK